MRAAKAHTRSDDRGPWPYGRGSLARVVVVEEKRELAAAGREPHAAQSCRCIVAGWRGVLDQPSAGGHLMRGVGR